MLVYEAVNKNNGKVYVGLTTTTLKQRMSSHLRSAKAGSKMHFHKALRKYGPEAFEWSEVISCSDIESLHKAEKLCISLYEEHQRYNKSLGGEHSAYGMRHTEEVKEVCREASKKRWEGRRATEVWPKEALLCTTYKDAKTLFNIPKTTWYRLKKNR
jgi:group I intron endonuclease